MPTLYVRLLAEPTLSREAGRNMRLFISGSAPLLLDTFEAFRERTGHTILERYGMTFLEALALYGAPAVIGVPARVYVVTTQVWSLFEYPPQVGMAAALSLPLALVTVALLWLQRILIGRRGFGTLRGKGGRWQRADLGACNCAHRKGAATRAPARRRRWQRRSRA